MKFSKYNFYLLNNCRKNHFSWAQDCAQDEAHLYISVSCKRLFFSQTWKKILIFTYQHVSLTSSPPKWRYWSGNFSATSEKNFFKKVYVESRVGFIGPYFLQVNNITMFTVWRKFNQFSHVPVFQLVKKEEFRTLSIWRWVAQRLGACKNRGKNRTQSGRRDQAKVGQLVGTGKKCKHVHNMWKLKWSTMTWAWGKEKTWVRDRNWTHDLPRVLYPLSYKNSLRERPFNWVLMWRMS